MAKGPSPQPWQVQQSATRPPGSKTPAPPVAIPVFATAPSVDPSAQPPVIPTDPKEFQKFLNDRGAKPKLKIDGIVGQKTLAAAQQLGVEVPPNLRPAAAAPAAPRPMAAPPAEPAPEQQTVIDEPRARPVDLGTLDEQVQRNYGYASWALSHPELGPLLRQAVGDPSTGEDDWDDTRFQGALMATNWFKTTSASRREWQALQSTDPQTAKLRVEQQTAAINGMAKQAGVNLDPNRAREIAENAVADDWTAAQINQALAGEFKYVAGGQAGQVAKAEQQLKRMAAAYLMPLSDDTLADWDRQIIGGADVEQFRQHMVNVAKGRFPTLSKMLDAGVTVLEVAEPYRQAASRELGVNPDSIDFNDSKWSRALMHVDPKTGDRRLMDDFEWSRTLRTDEQYGWDKTPNGIAAGYRVGNALAQALGLRR